MCVCVCGLEEEAYLGLLDSQRRFARRHEPEFSFRCSVRTDQGRERGAGEVRLIWTHGGMVVAERGEVRCVCEMGQDA